MTYGFNDVFSNQATDHKKVIEKMYSSELGKLGADVVITKVNSARDLRDKARGVCDGTASFFEHFESEGWALADLEMLTHKDASVIDAEILLQSGKKQSAIDNVAKDNELAKKSAEAKRVEELQVVKDNARKVVEKIRVMTKEKEDKYDTALAEYEKRSDTVEYVNENYDKLKLLIDSDAFLSEPDKTSITDIISIAYGKFLKLPENTVGESPIKPTLIPIDEMGIPQIPSDYDTDYEPLVKERQTFLDAYSELRDSALVYEEVTIPDTSAYDKIISDLQIKKGKVERENKVFARFCNWSAWMKAKKEYEDCMNELAMIYAKVDTGIDGLKIYPMEGGRSMDLWLKYDGSEDPDFFDNRENRPTFLFEYSAMQRAVLGVMIQASRLEKKEVGVRVCVIDEIPMTKLGVEMMERICEKYDVQLLTSYPDDRYDKLSPEDGVIIVEGGEVFFAGMKEKKEINV